jgi:hypothetical protein
VKVREHRQHDLAASFAVVSAGEDTLVVERAGEERREGFVMSVSELVATIQSWVLSAQGLDAVATLTVTSGAPRAGAGPGYDFVHRLAPPLDSRQVALRLSRLDDEDASSTLLQPCGAVSSGDRHRISRCIARSRCRSPSRNAATTSSPPSRTSCARR